MRTESLVASINMTVSEIVIRDMPPEKSPRVFNLGQMRGLCDEGAVLCGPTQHGRCSDEAVHARLAVTPAKGIDHLSVQAAHRRSNQQGRDEQPGRYSDAVGPAGQEKVQYGEPNERLRPNEPSSGFRPFGSDSITIFRYFSAHLIVLASIKPQRNGDNWREKQVRWTHRPR